MTAKDVQRDDVSNHWHLDKKVPLGIILAMLSQAAMGIWAIADIKKDVEVLKDRSIAQRERDEQQDKAQARQMLVLATSLERIDAKLDRLIERSHR